MQKYCIVLLQNSKNAIEIALVAVLKYTVFAPVRFITNLILNNIKSECR